jgi:hypothetical protein
MHLVGKLSPIVLQDVSGRDIRLGSLWEERTVVLVFIRHFG